MPQKISVSIIIHQQATLALNLLKDLNTFCDTQVEVLVTVNVPEKVPFTENSFNFPVSLFRNLKPKGFGANHNAAFQRKEGDYFCIANPDIRLERDPFRSLIQTLEYDRIAVAAPRITNAQGQCEDNIRRFPTPLSILRKALRIDSHTDYCTHTKPFRAEWVAGMFMLFKPEAYQAIGGFDERYHLYYEDVDICARLKLAGYDAMACPAATAIHEARRESHQNLRYLKWHIQSMLRFFLSRTYRRALALRSPKHQ